MNYRQWKKNYKKMHGCNPPFELDKRKQARTMRKALNKICSMDWTNLCNEITQAAEKAVEIVTEAIENYKKSLEE